MLQAIHDHLQSAGNEARVTHVAMRANVPYDRLVTYLEELANAGLVTRDKMPQLTAQGREFLAHYQRWTDVLGRFGLD